MSIRRAGRVVAVISLIEDEGVAIVLSFGALAVIALDASIQLSIIASGLALSILATRTRCAVRMVALALAILMVVSVVLGPPSAGPTATHNSARRSVREQPRR